jgi:hypothetical protein
LQSRDQLGLAAGAELDHPVVDGGVDVAMPLRGRAEGGPFGVPFVADDAEPQSVARVWDLMVEARR